MSDVVAKRGGALPKERPRFAWWRNLHCQANRTWDGDASNTFVHLPTVKRSSEHLKWAKQVHTQQKTWLQQHCQLCKPLPQRGAAQRAPRPRGPRSLQEESTASLPTLFGTVFKWATALRVDNSELAAVRAEERRELLQRRTCGLQRLRETQQKWRRDQRAWKQKQLQESPEASPLPSPSHEAFKPGRGLQSLETVESEDETSSEQTSKSSFGDGERSDHFGPIERPSPSESLHSSSSAEGQQQTFERERPPLVQTSMLRRNSAQRQGLLTQPVVGATAKDADGGDLSLEELFDAGNDYEHLEETQGSTAPAPPADYLVSTLLTRNGTDPFDQGQRRATLPDVLPAVLQEEFASCVRRQCETWRAEFPLEVLDQLSSAFDSWAEEDGFRKSSVRNLCHVLRYVLGWPPKILMQVLQDKSQEELQFKRLNDLLELMRDALQVAEMEEPDVLWSDWDLNLVKESFRKFASKSSSSMPVVNLFQAIHVLGFEELEVDSPDRQRWIAGITKEVLARKASRASVSVETSRRESWAPAVAANRVGVGAQLSFRDFLRISSRALREREKETRIEEFRAETKAVKMGNYGLLELEDMRELHSSFCSLKASMRSTGGKGNLDAMQELLQRCGVPPLDDTDVGKLRTLLRLPKEGHQNHQKEQVSAGRDDVSFVVFLRWMREIRGIGIEGLAALRFSNSSEVALQDLETRRGFHIAMLKEQFHMVWEDAQGGDDLLDGPRARGDSSLSKRLSAASGTSAQDRRLHP